MIVRVDAARNSATSRDLPTPALPRIVNCTHARSVRARSHASSSCSTLALAADERRVRAARDTPRRRSVSRSRYAVTGSDFPFASTGGTQLGVDRVADERIRRVADQHLTRAAPPARGAPRR